MSDRNMQVRRSEYRPVKVVEPVIFAFFHPGTGHAKLGNRAFIKGLRERRELDKSAESIELGLRDGRGERNGSKVGHGGRRRHVFRVSGRQCERVNDV